MRISHTDFFAAQTVQIQAANSITKGSVAVDSTEDIPTVWDA